MSNAHPFKPDVDILDANGDRKAIFRMRTIEEMADSINWSIDRYNSDSRDAIKWASQREESGNRSWYGTPNAGAYLDMLRDGWAAGVEGVEGLEGLSTDRAERLTFNRNVGGVFPVVPAYLAGAPDAMLEVRPAPVDNVRGLTLVIDSSFHSGIKGKTVLEYAQTVMKLVAWLQAEQIETSVYIVQTMDMADQQRIIYGTPVREAGDAFMPERIAACLHPSWLRRAWFAQCEREYVEYNLPGTGVCRHSYGHPRHATGDEMRKVLPDAYSVIMLPKVGEGDPKKAVQEAINIKLKQGE